MGKYDFKKEFLLERAVSVLSGESLLSESQAEIIKQVKDFGIDEIYFSTDETDSYPAVFLKKVTVFDPNTLSSIAEIQHKMWNYKKVLFLYVYNDTEVPLKDSSIKYTLKGNAYLTFSRLHKEDAPGKLTCDPKFNRVSFGFEKHE